MVIGWCTAHMHGAPDLEFSADSHDFRELGPRSFSCIITNCQFNPPRRNLLSPCLPFGRGVNGSSEETFVHRLRPHPPAGLIVVVPAAQRHPPRQRSLRGEHARCRRYPWQIAGDASVAFVCSRTPLPCSHCRSYFWAAEPISVVDWCNHAHQIVERTLCGQG
jgi:hypothetical protein